MLLGCIADDFTGASDLANTLAKGGMRATQFPGIPETGRKTDCEAGIIALKTRSAPVAEAVSQSLAALSWLQSQGCRQFFFKYCSTFDSTREGNIGPVAEALLGALNASSAIVCPAFPATGRSVFMGHLFVGDCLLNESGMQNHPLTPMVDADIRRWLSYQTSLPVGHVPLRVVSSGAEAIAHGLADQETAGKALIVVDAVSDADLIAIGRAVAGCKLVTGGSGVALGLPDNFRSQGLLRDDKIDFTGIEGAGVVLSGSCSIASRRQVEIHATNHPSLFIDAADLISGRMTVDGAVEFVLRNQDRTPMIYSTADPDIVSERQEIFGRERVAREIEDFFGKLAARLVASGVRRIVVGGGETAGAVVTGLDLAELVIGPEIDPGVPALASDKDGPIRLALKSGNFGAPDFFDKAMRMLGS